MTRRCWLLVMALACEPGRALADDPQLPDPAGQAHMEAGKQAYAAGDYATASREFQAAYALSPEPVLLYGWAQAERLGGNCDAATALYKRFLAHDLTEAQIAAARSGLALCEGATSTSGSEPEPANREPEPQRTDAVPVSTQPAVVSPTSDDGASWYKDPIGGGLVLAGVTSAGIGITFLVFSKRSERAAHDAEFRDDFVGLLDEATMRRRIAYVGMGLGTVLVVGGIVRLATVRARARDVVIATTGSSILVSGSF